MSKGAGQRLSLSGAALERFQKAFSDPAVETHIEECTRLMAAGDQAGGLQQLETAILLAQVIGRGDGGGGGPRTEAMVHRPRAIAEDVPDAATRLLRILQPTASPSFYGSWTEVIPSMSEVTKATKALMDAMHDCAFEATSEPPAIADSRVLFQWALDIRDRASAMLIDERGSFHFSGDHVRPREETSRRQERKSKDVLRAVAQKGGGGPIDAIEQTDADGNQQLEATSNGIGENVRKKQQENSFSQYWFPQVCKQVLFNPVEEVASDGRTAVGDRLEVASEEEVRVRTQLTVEGLRGVSETISATLESSEWDAVTVRGVIDKLSTTFVCKIPDGVAADVEMPAAGGGALWTPAADTCVWLTDRRDEIIIMIGEVREAPDLANTMRTSQDVMDKSESLAAGFLAALAYVKDADELRAMIQKMPAGKTGGPAGPAREHLLALPDHVLDIFRPIVNSILDGTCTDALKLGTIVPLAKPEAGKFRPVTLLHPLWKAVMMRVSDRMLDLFYQQGILDEAQFAFVKFGSTAPPIDIINAVVETSMAEDKEAHLVFLDATSAYDVVPHWVLDVALRRLGAPEQFITWARLAVDGHTRIVASAAGVTSKAAAFPLGGLAQGDPLSPVLWVTIADMALSHARAAPRMLDESGAVKVAGFKLAEAGETPDAPSHEAIGVPIAAYADDLTSVGESHQEAQTFAQRMVTMLGIANIRVQAKKCVYLRSRRAVANAESAPFVLDGLKVERAQAAEGVGSGEVGAFNPASNTYAVTWEDGSSSAWSFSKIAAALVALSLVGRLVMQSHDAAKEDNEAAAKDGTITDAFLDRGGNIRCTYANGLNACTDLST